MSSGTIRNRADYFVGQTLNLALKPCCNPFSDESIIGFTSAFENRYKEQNSLNCNAGQYNIVTSLVQEQSEKLKALGVGGNLEFSYGPISGDSNVQFARNNIDSLLSLSMIIKATQSGRIIKNGLSDFVKLKLRHTLLKQKLTFEQFTKKYGAYLIVGFEYGGQILFDATYSTKSSEDKMSVAGGLSLCFGKMGFNVKGSVNGNYKTEDINKSTNITTEYSIFPSFNNELINGQNGIISLLNKISDPMANNLSLITEEKNQSFGNIRSELDSKMQQLLSGKKLDSINAIILPIKNIDCVMDMFSDQINQMVSIQNFFKFTNPLYFKLKELKKGLESIDAIYDKYNNDQKIKFQKPHKIINEWNRALNKVIVTMDYIENEDELYKYAKKQSDFIINDFDEKQQAQKEIHKEFYKMNTMILQNEFNSDILDEFNKHMMNNTMLCFKCKKQMKLCSAANCYSTSNAVSCDHCGTTYYGNSKVYHCTNNCNFDQCVSCKPTCFAKHGLALFLTDKSTFSCNSCGIKVGQNTLLFGCRKCNYDLCPMCYGVKTDIDCIKCRKQMTLCAAQDCYQTGAKCDVCGSIHRGTVKVFHCLNGCHFDKCILCKKTCPGKHELQQFKTNKNGYSCNQCHEKKMKGILLYGCRKCNYDLCGNCMLLKY